MEYACTPQLEEDVEQVEIRDRMTILKILDLIGLLILTVK